MLHRVEVAEADALEGREGVVGPHRRGRSGIWMRAITLTLNQNSAPAGTTIATTISADLRFSARSRNSDRITSRRPSSASSPSTAQYFLFRSPQAIASIRAVNATMPLTAGRSPPIFWPAMKAIRLAAAAAKVTRAPIVSTSGRSPSSIGSSCSRTAAFLPSERETRWGGAAGFGSAARGSAARGSTAWAGSARRLRLRLPTERLRRGTRVVGLGDRADDGDALRADRGGALSIDATNHEPRDLRVLLRILDERDAHGLEPGFGSG